MDYSAEIRKAFDTLADVQEDLRRLQNCLNNEPPDNVVEHIQNPISGIEYYYADIGSIKTVFYDKRRYDPIDIFPFTGKGAEAAHYRRQQKLAMLDEL